MLTWELLGAVVGAGLASGREIAAFFSRYGAWGMGGIVLAVFTLAWFTGTETPPFWRGRWLERGWDFLLTAMLIATGGAMLSGGGVVVSLLLPIRHAEAAGAVLTLLLAWLLAYHTRAGQAWVSQALMFLLGMLLLLGLFLPRMSAVTLPAAAPGIALAKGCTYGGFNAALQTVLLAGKGMSAASKRHSIRRAALLLCCILLLGHGVLLRHPALLTEPMPFIRLMASLGRPGFVMGACNMYLAILSTLTAALRALKRRALPILGIAAVSVLGFSDVVETVYPLLGGGCLLWLGAAKFRNSAGRPFISRADML